MQEIILYPVLNESVDIPSTFKKVCDDPKSLLTFIISHIQFKLPDGVKSIFVVSDQIPKGEDRGKLWIKTSFPYGIGMLIDGIWRMDYGMSGYPVGMPFLHKAISPLLEGMTELSNADVEKYGLTNTTNTATERMLWYLIEEPTLTQ